MRTSGQGLPNAAKAALANRKIAAQKNLAHIRSLVMPEDDDGGA